MSNPGRFNMEMRKTDVAMCYTCENVCLRSELKYISKFPFVSCVPSCSTCRSKYKKSKIMRYFVKFLEEARN